MSLFGSLQIANNALIASQLGLQVVGNNIANANTPGYLRQELVLATGPTQIKGGLVLGLGVNVDAIIQKTDRFLEQRLRAATSDLAYGESREQTYLRLETLLGELNDTDLSSSFNRFFATLHDVVNQPESVATRNLAVLQGRTLADDIRRLDGRVRELRKDVNGEIVAAADDINRLLKTIADFNVKIAATEAGEANRSDAVGLRDRRGVALAELASIIDIRTVEQTNGSVSVFLGGDFLVTEGIHRPVTVEFGMDRGLVAAEVMLHNTGSPVRPSSGKLGGLLSARDEVLAGFLDQLDHLAGTLISEFNKVHASGQGLVGFQQLTSEWAVTDVDAPLDAAGLRVAPVNGSFQVLLRNTQTGVTRTVDIRVPLGGLDDDDMSLAELVAELHAIDGLSAAINPTRGLSLAIDSPNLEFTFANDTSGVLAALGINTFFTGSGAQNIDVSGVLRRDPSLLASSRGGSGHDVDNGLALASLLERPLPTANGRSLAGLYDRLTADVTQSSALARGVADGFRVFQAALEGQHLAVSGVNLDEEAVKMISYQRSYQATARLIATLNELLQVLVNL